MKKGFTLIELLVVVLIIGILAAIAVPKYQVAVAKSRTQTALPILKALSDAERIYYLSTGDYTTSIEDLDISIDNSLYGDNINNEKYYKYSCNKQYCNATSKNPSLPELLFYHPQTNNGIYLCNKRNKNDIAKAICEQIGTLDPIFDEYSFGKGNYYRIN